MSGGGKVGAACVGRHSPCVERCWLQERKPVDVGESHAAPTTIFPTASGVSPWKVHNRRVDPPLIGLDC